MTGLVILRPLASGAKSTAPKHSSLRGARAEKGRDDVRRQGQGRAVSPTFSRARVLLAPGLHRNVPAAPPTVLHPVYHHSSQRQNVVPAQVQQPGAVAPTRRTSAAITTTEKVTSTLFGNASGAAASNDNVFGVDITQRVGGVDYGSSGSEHEPSTVCLAEMVYDYIEDDSEMSKCGRARCNCGNNCSSEDRSTGRENDDSKSSMGGEISDVLVGLIPCVSPCEKSILSSVTSTLLTPERDDDSESDDGEKRRESARSSLTRRLLISSLRASGYNAAICKSRWEHSGFPGGNYEYIDCIMEVGGKTERIIVDIEFKAQFEIARPTSLYSALLQSLPSVYVGKADRLQHILNIMCDSAKRSLKKKGLHLPPWRTLDYMRAKWFAAYRRTTNGASSGYWSTQGK